MEESRAEGDLRTQSTVVDVSYDKEDIAQRHRVIFNLSRQTIQQRDHSAENELLTLERIQKVCSWSSVRLRRQHINFCTLSVVTTDIEKSSPSWLRLCVSYDSPAHLILWSQEGTGKQLGQQRTVRSSCDRTYVRVVVLRVVPDSLVDSSRASAPYRPFFTLNFDL